MLNNKNRETYAPSSKFNADILRNEDVEIEIGLLEVSGTGKINVINTGGQSASEGGMGSDSDDDKAKGDITKPGGGKSANSAADDDEDTRFDPIKKNVREAE